MELVQVKSQTKDQPQDHGIRVAPSGRLPSLQKSPGGSNMAGTPALRSEPCDVEYGIRRFSCMPGHDERSVVLWHRKRMYVRKQWGSQGVVQLIS